MENLSIFAERLNELIIDGKTNPHDFADKMGVAPSIAYRWLKGVSYPTLSNLISISNLFGVSIDFLLGRVSEQYPFSVSDDKTFPEILSTLLRERTTEYRLCKDTGIARSKIFDWKNGIRQPLPEGLIALADYFDCSIDALIGREKL